jgi:hypothetical protein
MRFKSSTCLVSPRAPIFLLLIISLETASVDVKLDPRGNGVAPALILAEMIPCAPDRPTVAVKVRVLEVYRIAHVRCPQLAIQSFVKSLCDLHGVRGWRCCPFATGAKLHTRSLIDRTCANNFPLRTTCTSTYAVGQMIV